MSGRPSTGTPWSCCETAVLLARRRGPAGPGRPADPEPAGRRRGGRRGPDDVVHAVRHTLLRPRAAARGRRPGPRPGRTPHGSGTGGAGGRGRARAAPVVARPAVHGRPAVPCRRRVAAGGDEPQHVRGPGRHRRALRDRAGATTSTSWSSRRSPSVRSTSSEALGIDEEYPHQIGKPNGAVDGTMVFSRLPLGEPVVPPAEFQSFQVEVGEGDDAFTLLAVHPRRPGAGWGAPVARGERDDAGGGSRTRTPTWCSATSTRPPTTPRCGPGTTRVAGLPRAGQRRLEPHLARERALTHP